LIDWIDLIAGKPAPKRTAAYTDVKNSKRPVEAGLLAMSPARAIYPYRLTFRKQNQKHYLLYLYTKA
jgi:hypothetical protein